MVVRDELLLVLDLTSTLLRAGLGVLDPLRGPLLELPTRVGRMAGTPGTRVEHYLVGAQLAAAEAATAASGGERDYALVDPCRVDPRTGFEVTDWTALEAVFRYALHASLQLQRPPLAHPAVLAVPSGCPPPTVDALHRLLFERLLLPQLLVAPRPFFAAGAAGALSCVVLDLGYRGEGSEVSLVHDNQVLPAPSGLRLPDVDEGACDDYCALQLLLAQPDLPHQLLSAAGRDPTTASYTPGELAHALRAIVTQLKVRDLLGLESPLVGGRFARSGAGAAGVLPGGIGVGADEDGSFDVARAIVEGKVDDLVHGSGPHKGKRKDPAAADGDGNANDKDDEDDDDDSTQEYVRVTNPLASVAAPPPSGGPAAKPEVAGDGEVNGSAPPAPAPAPVPAPESAPASAPEPAPASAAAPPPSSPPRPRGANKLRIGPARHKYLEPLFQPSLLAALAPSASPAAALLGLHEYERFASPGPAASEDAGVAEMIGVALSALEDAEVRSAVGEAVVVVSSGRIANNRALGPALVHLLTPFRSDLAAAYDAEGQPTSRPMRYLRSPEYFANFKERAGDWMTYLGACVMGKLLLGDSQAKLFMSKQDYAKYGPSYYRQLDPVQS